MQNTARGSAVLATGGPSSPSRTKAGPRSLEPETRDVEMKEEMKPARKDERENERKRLRSPLESRTTELMLKSCSGSIN